MDRQAQPEELRASKVAAITSLVLAAVKVAAGAGTGSLALLASGGESIFDALASGAGYLFLKMSLEPADEEHPYGHSRIETVASLGQGVFLLVICASLAWAATGRFSHDQEPAALDTNLYVSIFAAAVTFALIAYMGRVVGRTRSTVVAADRVHYISDFAGNVLLAIGFVIARFWHAHNVDAIMTLILCVFILHASISILRDAVKHLVDYSDPDSEKQIASVISTFYPETLGASRIRSRRSGRRTSVDIELLSCRRLPFQEVHDIAHKVQEAVLAENPRLDIIIHSEPCTDETCAGGCKIQGPIRKNFS